MLHFLYIFLKAAQHTTTKLYRYWNESLALATSSELETFLLLSQDSHMLLLLLWIMSFAWKDNLVAGPNHWRTIADLPNICPQVISHPDALTIQHLIT
jgi:hypothetical protein